MMQVAEGRMLFRLAALRTVNHHMSQLGKDKRGLSPGHGPPDTSSTDFYLPELEDNGHLLF